MDKNDLEKDKFELQTGKVALKTSYEIPGIDDIGNRNINDMEKDKINTNGDIRIVTAI